MRLPVEIAGAALREFLIPALNRLFDAMDPAGTAPGWTAPKPVEVACPDTAPDALLVRW